MRFSLGLISVAVGLLACVCDARAQEATEIAKALKKCRQMVSDGLRLSCYDDLADARERERKPPRFEGRHNVVTDTFKIEQPTKMRFRSEGVIFVLYLKDEAGNVVQNLHIGGVGEDEYLIEKPGIYFLQINGAEEWEIWLDPDPE